MLAHFFQRVSDILLSVSAQCDTCRNGYFAVSSQHRQIAVTLKKNEVKLDRQ